MAANMRCEKNSLVLLSSKRTKAFSRTRADEAFALPSFSDSAAPTFAIEPSHRLGRGPKVDHCSNDVERLKQTMLQHESMFKEQLYELHRLYQVQRLLMEESKRKGLASNPRSDSPSSNSSLLYNPESCKPKGETRFWDTKEVNKSSLCKHLSFFPGQIDMNKPHEDKSYTERPVNASFPKDCQRPVIDLEQPAEEHMEIEEKPLVSDTFLKTVGNSNMWHASWQALQCSTPSEERADIRSISMGRESLGSTRRSLEDCFTPECSRHKEVPFFPLGPTKFGDGEAYPCHAQTLPVASLFGVRLSQENTNREKKTQAGQNNLEEKRKEPQISSTDTCCRSTGESSKLPHWLLQESPSISARTSPVKPAAQNSLRQHQTLPFLLQNHEERNADSNFYDRVCSVSQQELSSSWPKSGTRLQFGESFLKAPQGKKPSSGYFLDASRETVQGLHKLAQTSSLTESMPFVTHARDERGVGGLQVPATGYVSSPASDKQSPALETHAGPAAFLQNFSSKGLINGAPTHSWYQQQKSSSPVIPQVPKAGIQSQRSLNAFSVNSLNAWANSSCREVQPGIFTRGTIDSGGENNRNLKGSSPSFATKPEASSKRLIFGFMPTASDLELTLGLDLNASGTLETPKRVEDSSMFGNAIERESRIDLESKLTTNDFDLNVQSGQGLDACCPAESHVIPTGFKQDSDSEMGHGWRTPSGVQATYYEEWQTLRTSLDLKNKPELAITSTVTPLWSANASFTKMDTHREAPFAENLYATSVNGAMFVAGKSSDGSGLTSCDSRSMSIPVVPKARDHSNTSSGELCQSIEVKISAQNEGAAYSLNLPPKNAMEKLFDETPMMVRRQPGMFSAMPGCSHVSQGDPAEDLLVAKCANVDNREAADNNADEHVTKAFEAADILLRLGLDLPAAVIEDRDVDDQERALKWLADIIPQEESSGIGARETNVQSSEACLESAGFQERELDSFERSVLRLKPVNPDTEKFFTPPIERGDLAEDCSPHPNLRRRSQRRGRLGKDFQKEMLPSIASLSRQEITEDLQIIEGLVKSATEAMARCSLSPKEEAPWPLPDLSSVKTCGKVKGSRSCKAGKQNGLLRVCSWGESTRRRRMRRQRSQWMCLPPGV